MQCLYFIQDFLRNLDADAELTTFLCSFIIFFILKSMRSHHFINNAKISKSMDPGEEEDFEFLEYGQVEKALETAFEEEDSWQALKLWNQLKHYEKSSIHLPMMMRTMRSCNKGSYYIATEIKNFFKAHPHIASISLINDLLEPVARRPDEAQLAELIARMIPTIRLSKDSRTYEILMTMHVANRNLEKAQEVMVEMKNSKTSFTPCATVAVMTIGLQTRNFELALKAFTKLKSSWDVRNTWAVSMFSLEGHKANLLKEFVELAHEAEKMCELLPAMVGMKVPEEVLALVRAKLSLWSDVDIAAAFAVLKKTCSSVSEDAIYKTVVGCLKVAENNKLPPWKRQPAASQDSSREASVKNPLPPWKRQLPLSEAAAGGDACRKKMQLPPWKRQTSDSEASTSDGSRSSSQEDSTRASFVGPPPGLTRA